VSDELAAGVGAALELAHRWWPLTGAAVCVVDGERELLLANSGLADAASGAPVDGGTRFEIGSISKSCTSFVLGALADDGRIDLSAPVLDHVPWLVPRERFAAITLRHLMAHTAGLVSGSDAVPDAEASVLALSATAAGAAPGELFNYSNVGYALLGLVIEQVTGQAVAEVVTERLLGPLGMKDSAAAITHAARATMATGYQALHDDRPLLPGDPLVPAPWFEAAAADGNVVATASDLGRYARMLLGRGRLDGTAIVTAERFSELIDEQHVADGERHYALGLEVEREDGGHRLSHGGGMVGYSSFLIADLEARRGVVVLTNANGGAGVAERLARHVLALAVGGPPPGVALALDASAIPDAAAHAGTYGAGALQIDVRPDGADGLLLVADGVTGRLHHLGGGRLGCDHPRWRRFAHRLAGTGETRRWLCGPHALAVAGTPQDPPAPLGDDPFAGHYRSWTPWYPSFRVVRREGVLRLIAGTGVEAPDDEPELVPVGDRTFRIGADPRLPERLVFGPPVDGRCLEVARDGCRYSRSFRP
jgi:D-alanyl-D-alanine carboxypeptidase